MGQFVQDCGCENDRNAEACLDGLLDGLGAAELPRRARKLDVAEVVRQQSAGARARFATQEGVPRQFFPACRFAR